MAIKQVQERQAPNPIKTKWYHFHVDLQSPASTNYNPDQTQKLFLSGSVNVKGTQTYSSNIFTGLRAAFEHLMTEQSYPELPTYSQDSRSFFPHSTSCNGISWTPLKIELQAKFSTYSDLIAISLA